MKHHKGMCWILLGTMLLLAALSLVLYNRHTDRASGTQTQALLEQLREQIVPPETEATEPSGLIQEYQTEQQPEPETTLEVDGNTYLGVLEIPELGLELPVLASWSYPNLKLAPCRYAGTVAEGNLILAAHNYQTHFGTIESLNTGAVLLFTTCSGVTHRYEVVQSDLIDGKNTEAMEAGDDEWDLTLFTCTLSGVNRVTVRAVESETQ